ncbi:unnamed protein product [Urochloa humidicola]
MEFRIHVLGLEYYYNPKELYRNERIRYMRFLEPAKVEWDPMVETLKCYGHMWDSDVFYLDPMSEAPDGLVLMKGPEQVDELLHAHLGRKICDLYLVNTDSWSDSDDDEQEEEIEEALSGESLKEFMARMDRISSDENNVSNHSNISSKAMLIYEMLILQFCYVLYKFSSNETEIHVAAARQIWTVTKPGARNLRSSMLSETNRRGHNPSA